MLHSCRCEVFGLEEGGDPGFIACDTEDVLVSVVGSSTAGAIADAVTREWGEDVVVAQLQNDSYVAEALPGWEAG